MMISEWSTPFKEWNFGYSFYFYCTKEQERNGKVQTTSTIETATLYCSHSIGSLQASAQIAC